MMTHTIPRKKSPSASSIEWLRSEGYEVETVERWVPRAKVRQDLFGMFDLCALWKNSNAGYALLGVQVTDMTNFSARVKKVRACNILWYWLHSGNRAEVHAWGYRGARGKKKLWTLKRREFILDTELKIRSFDPDKRVPQIFWEKVNRKQ